jgi:putative ABC transport system permease protein
VEVKVDGGGTGFMNGVDVQRAMQVFNFDWQQGGSDDLFTQLGQNGAVVEENFAEDHNLAIGDSFTVTSIDNRERTFQVLGVYKDPILFTGFTVSEPAYDALVVDPEPSIIVVEFEDGADAAATQKAVEDALLETFPTAEVRSNAEYKENLEDQVGTLRNLLYALLILPVVISLFGIINTLVLAVFERTREIGMLRAIGTSRRQVRMMIRNESVITAVIGGVLGLIIGLFFGWIITKALEDEGITFAVPWLQLVFFLALAIVAGIIAASLPARRAARLDVLKALQYE